MPKAINSAGMRQKNEKMILSLINRAPISRADIAKKTGLTKAAVTIITDDLIKRGILSETAASSDGAVGRTPVLLSINKDSVYIIGINISRVDITVGLCDLGGRVFSEKSFSARNPDEAFRKIKLIVDNMTSSLHGGEVYKIGVVTPGPVDTARGVILNPPNFDLWHGVSIVEKISLATNAEVCFENVSNGTALAERFFGSAKSIKSFVSVQVDEGIGSGIIINNSLFTGLCELGHISVSHDGVKCECGNNGCLEKYASVTEALKDTPYVSWSEASEDDGVVRREAEFLSSALISVNNIFGLDAAVLCGEVADSPHTLIEAINEKISGRMLSGKGFSVVPGSVKSKTLVAASVAAGSFFGIEGIRDDVIQ